MISCRNSLSVSLRSSPNLALPLYRLVLSCPQSMILAFFEPLHIHNHLCSIAESRLMMMFKAVNMNTTEKQYKSKPLNTSMKCNMVYCCPRPALFLISAMPRAMKQAASLASHSMNFSWREIHHNISATGRRFHYKAVTTQLNSHVCN
jgi:hypothetical protein